MAHAQVAHALVAHGQAGDTEGHPDNVVPWTKKEEGPTRAESPQPLAKGMECEVFQKGLPLHLVMGYRHHPI